MLFNTYTFWVFFAVVLSLYGLLAQTHRQKDILIVASYLFYGWWDWRFLPIVMFSTIIDYRLGLLVHRASSPRSKRHLLAVSVCVNLIILGIFKYYNFFSHELLTAASTIGLHLSLPLIRVILPVGISFYTFQSMSYVWDVARGATKPSSNFWEFSLYVCFFPHLVAGPIMRSGNSENGKGLLKQIRAPRHYRSGDFQIGFYQIVLGLFKKVVIGDNLATIANAVFNADKGTVSGAECLVGVYAFALQIYADFSGYSSIAQGVAKWMGFDLMTNFRMPYLAISPSDFWRRWHISLSTWLRDYVYISFGGNRHGTYRTYRNLFLTMLLGGLWHGANWTFIAWGAFHGLLLCVYRFMWDSDGKRTIRDYGRLPGLARAFVFFQLVCFGWLLFRPQSIE